MVQSCTSLNRWLTLILSRNSRLYSIKGENYETNTPAEAPPVFHKLLSCDNVANLITALYFCVFLNGSKSLELDAVDDALHVGL